jgi:polyisoprenoid-binding protein YceI
MLRIVLGLVCAGLLAGADAVLELDPANTEIAFTVSDTLHTVHGAFKLTETGKALGESVIDVPSGASGSGMRDRRMQKEILESAKYPEARFTPERVGGRLGQSELDHELTLHFKVVMEDGGYTASRTLLFRVCSGG